MQAEGAANRGQVSITLSEDDDAVYIDNGASQTHPLPEAIVKNSRLLQDLIVADGSRASLPFAYDAVVSWAKLVESNYEEPESPTLDELVGWLRVRVEQA
jgi:hypothetical protein